MEEEEGMKLAAKFMFLSALLLVFVAGCAKKPDQEISAARAAIDAVVAEGGEKYAAEETKGLNDSLNAALAEVETQDKKFFKNFDAAKQQLAKVTSDANALKAEIPARKEAAKTKAMESLTAATTAVEEAKKMVAKAPRRGKEAMAEIAALKADLAGLETSLTEVQPLIDSEEYIAAAEKAEAITAKATEVSGQIEEAIAKLKGKK
jgi:hypothetical protein